MPVLEAFLEYVRTFTTLAPILFSSDERDMKRDGSNENSTKPIHHAA